LSIAVGGGFSPVFFNDTSTSDDFVSFPDLESLLTLHDLPLISPLPPSLVAIDDQLAGVWKVLSNFSSVVNSVTKTGLLFSERILFDTMASTMYRLTAMSFASASLNEVVRIGLLAFCATVFLRWRSVGMTYAHLAQMLRSSLLLLSKSAVIAPRLRLWLLLIGRATLLDEADDSWLQPAIYSDINLCNINRWEHMQDLLKSFIWIDLVHEQPAKLALRSIMVRFSTKDFFATGSKQPRLGLSHNVPPR
jgi:hypothetical protein